jgi:DNA-binding CsgD family transcriptional regulator
VQRGPHHAGLRLVVTPLRSRNRAAEIPWLGLRAPVAIVTIADPEISRQRLAQDLNERFGLTVAEAGLAAEIVKGDGREAAARRRGISVATARSQLASIFEKTGTHRQRTCPSPARTRRQERHGKMGDLTPSRQFVVICGTKILIMPGLSFARHIRRTSPGAFHAPGYFRLVRRHCLTTGRDRGQFSFPSCSSQMFGDEVRISGTKTFVK